MTDKETLDINFEELRKIGYKSIDIITDYLKNINDLPILPNDNLDQMRTLIEESIPMGEKNSFELLDECQNKIIKNAVKVGNAKLLGWILPSSNPIGCLSDGIASAINQNVSISGSSISTAIELLVLDWIKEIIGYDKKAGGILVSGGSVANLIALTIARNVKSGIDIKQRGLKNSSQLILYVSNEIHSCILKAANILGIGTNNVCLIQTDQNYKINTTLLEEKIKQDIKDNKKPIAVVAIAGTVNTGSIDPLTEISEICKRYDLWFHIDAAYGGFAALSNKYKNRLNGIEKADSVVLDPHKWLFIPYEAGCILVKNPNIMKETFSTKSDYINLHNDELSNKDDIDLSDYGIQLSRYFRALKIWMSLKRYGIKKYEKIIDNNINLAYEFKKLLDITADFEVLSPIHLSIVCFRYVPFEISKKYADIDSNQKQKINDYLNKLNQTIAISLRNDCRALVSTTVLKNNILALRLCIVNYRTTIKDLNEIINIIQKYGQEIDKKERSKSL